MDSPTAKVGPCPRCAAPHRAHFCDCGPATSADLLELDAVPEPVDSAEPAATHLPGCAPVGPSAKTTPMRRSLPLPAPSGEAPSAELDARGARPVA